MHFKIYLEDSFDLNDVSWIIRMLTLTILIKRSLFSKKTRRLKHYTNVIIKYKIKLIYIKVYLIIKVFLINV